MAIRVDFESGVKALENHPPTAATSAAVEPLLRRKNGVDPLEAASESLCVVLLSTAVAISGSFEFGSCVGFSSPTQSGIRNDIGLSLSQYAMFGSLLTIGAMVGAITSGRIADFIGRRGAMRISAAFCILGWLAILFAQDALLLYFGRLSSGYGIGILSYVVPVFIAEIAPKNLRGGLTTLNQLLICAGGSAAYIVGTFVTWRQLVLLGIAPCLVLLVGLFLIPESPRWLHRSSIHNSKVTRS